MAVLAALIASALLTALALSIALLGLGESALAANARTARALRHASSAAAELAVADLRGLPSWAGVLQPGLSSQVSASAGRFVDSSLVARAPWDGSPIDLRAMTDAVQTAADANRGPADAPQTWRLLDYGPLGRVAPGLTADPWYLAVWVADDSADTDGDPGRDNNGVLRLHAVALGPSEAVMAVDLSVVRIVVAGAPDRIRVLTVRPGE